MNPRLGSCNPGMIPLIYCALGEAAHVPCVHLHVLLSQEAKCLSSSALSIVVMGDMGEGSFCRK